MDLRKLFQCIIWTEIICFIFILITPSVPYQNAVADSSAFANFWNGLWYLLFVLWVIGWISLLREWKRGFQIYLAGWVASLAYNLLSGVTAESALESTVSSLMSLLGGAILMLLSLRKFGIVHWEGSSKKKNRPSAR